MERSPSRRLSNAADFTQMHKKPVIQVAPSSEKEVKVDIVKLTDKILALRHQFVQNAKRKAIPESLVNVDEQLQGDPFATLQAPKNPKHLKRSSFRVGRAQKQIKIENLNPEQDKPFIKKILTPYLSSVYFSLISRQNKDYLTVQRVKQYLGLPELLGNRVTAQINANGDERIDHDEFVNFFLALLMGNLHQKMQLAFKCYDFDDDDIINETDVLLILRNLPMFTESRFGISFGLADAFSKNEIFEMQSTHHSQVDQFAAAIFSEHPEGMFFDEFVKFALEVSGELFFNVFEYFYQHIPCVKNFFILKQNYRRFLESDQAYEAGIKYQPPTYTILMPLITDRSVERVKLLEDEQVPHKKQPSAYLKQKFKNALEDESDPDSSHPSEESPIQAKKRKSMPKITELSVTKKGDSGTQVMPGPLDYQRINSIKEVDEGSECSTIHVQSRNAKVSLHKTIQPMRQAPIQEELSPVKADLMDESPAYGQIIVENLPSSSRNENRSKTKNFSFSNDQPSFFNQKNQDRNTKGMDTMNTMDSNINANQSTLLTHNNEETLAAIRDNSSLSVGRKEGKRRGSALRSVTEKKDEATKQVIQDVERKLEEREKELPSISTEIAHAKRTRATKRDSMNKFKTIDNLQEALPGFTDLDNDESSQDETEKQGKKKSTIKKKKTSIKTCLTKKLQSKAGGAQGEDEQYRDLPLTQFEGTSSNLTDGFGLPLRLDFSISSGNFIALTRGGSLRFCYMVLLNQELYIYSSKESEKYEALITLTPGVYVKAGSHVNISQAQQLSLGRSVHHLYPLELTVGGQRDNFGVATLLNKGEEPVGLYTFFFESHDVQHRWARQLQVSTGNYEIHEYYSFSSKSSNFRSIRKLQKQQTRRQSYLLSPSQIKQSQIFQKDFIFDLENFEPAERAEKKKKLKEEEGILGLGKNGSVIVSGRHKKSQKKVAIKIIKKNPKIPNQFDDLRDQVSVFQLAQHPNILKLEDYFEKKDTFYLCMEIQSQKTLYDFFEERQDQMFELEIRDIFKKLASALDFLHLNGVILRNLAATGILMSQAVEDVPNDNGQPIISHLDKAIVLAEEEKTSGHFGDVRFQAPEVVKLKPYSFKADVWSLGVILFYMLTKQMPFQDEESSSSSDLSSSLGSSMDPKAIGFDQLEQKIAEAEPNFKLVEQRGYSSSVVDLLKRMLAKLDLVRVSTRSVLKHEWFNAKLTPANANMAETSKSPKSTVQNTLTKKETLRSLRSGVSPHKSKPETPLTTKRGKTSQFIV